MKKSGSKLLMTFLLIFLTLMAGGCGGSSGGTGGAEKVETPSAENLNIKVWIDGLDFSAILNDTDASRQFASMLPLEVEMTDWLSREKVARLPETIFIEDAPVKPFEAGDITYYAPGRSLAIFYTSEGSTMVPGLYSLGSIEWGSEFLKNSGEAVWVRIELAETQGTEVK